MQEVNLDDFHKIILKALFLDGESTIYEIEKKWGLSHSTVHKKTHELLKMGLLEVKEEKPFRTGLNLKRFGLTDKGFFEALKNMNFEDKLVADKLDELAEQNPPPHPLLPLWPFFREIRAQNFFKLMLVNFEVALPHLLISLLQQEETPFPFEQGEFKPIKILSEEQQKSLLEKIKKNEDLYQKILTKIELNIKNYEVELRNLKKIKELLLGA